MENNRIKRILKISRENEFFTTMIFVIVAAMFIGLCAHNQNMKKEISNLQEQVMQVQNNVSKIVYEVTK